VNVALGEARKWVAGARPRTLPAAIVPVAVGTACARGEAQIIWWRVAAALVVALALQVGTNYANDYSDGVRGTDTGRVGPVRLVASGLATPAQVQRAALVAFGVAALAGLALTVAVGPELLLVGALSIAAGWFYTGGPRPYGYLGLGELLVFVFFGLVATAGTTYVLVERLIGVSVVAGVAVGLLACALLVVNNLRDIPTDAAAGKRTLAVRLGDWWTRRLYVALVSGAFVVAALAALSRPWALLALLAVPLAVPPVQAVREQAIGAALVPVLGATGRLQLGFGALFALGLAVGS
jgi:1,4-dihydroxy-2-naphthoate octaprenyltransferase